MRRHYAMLIVIALLFSFVFPSVIPGANAYASTENNDEASAILNALGITSGDYAESSGMVSKGEFATLVTRMLRIDSSAWQWNVAINETAKNPEDLNNLYTLYKIGIVSGNEYGNLGADDPISYAQAMKILVCALGYEVHAIGRGSYPTGYLSMGISLGISKNLNYESTMALDRKSVIRMLFNCLEVTILEASQFGEYVTYTSSNGNNILSKYFDVYRGYGQVDGNANTRLGRGDSHLAKNRVSINEEVFLKGDTHADSLIGYNVIYYAQVNQDSTKTLIHIMPDQKRTMYVTVPDGRINEQTSYSEFIYNTEDDSNSIRLRLLDVAMVIYNGKYLGRISSIPLALLSPDSGEVTLLDNDNDGKYDIVIITDYELYFVNQVSGFYSTITDRYTDAKVELDIDKHDYEAQITLDGAAITVEDIKINDIVAVAQSEDGKVRRAVVTRNTVNGKALEIFQNKVNVDGQQYRMMEHLKDRIPLAREARFYLDQNGSIVAIDEQSAIVGRLYGYLFRLAAISPVSNQVNLKILNADGEMLVHNLAQTLKYKNKSIKATSYKEMTEIYDSDTEETKRQLIVYELNGNNEITLIDTATTVIEGQNGNFDELVESNTFRHHTERATLSYRGNSKSFNGEFFLNAAVKVFLVPRPGSPEADDEERYATYKQAYFRGDTSYYNIVPYDVTEARVATVILLYEREVVGDTRVEATAPLVLLDRISEGINEDGEIVKKLIGLMDKKVTELFILNENVISGKNLKKGDVLRLSLDTKNRVNDIVVALDSSKKEENKFVTGAFYSDMQLVSGEVVKVFNTEQKLKIDVGSDTVIYDIANFEPNVYIFNPKTKSVSIGSKEDIANGDMILFRNRWDRIYELIISRYSD